jgi:hypothetical protein
MIIALILNPLMKAPCKPGLQQFEQDTRNHPAKNDKKKPRKLFALLAAKWEKPYSEVCEGDIKTRMSIAIVRATHLCLRGSRTSNRTSKMKKRLPQWDEEDQPA